MISKKAKVLTKPILLNWKFLHSFALFRIYIRKYRISAAFDVFLPVLAIFVVISKRMWQACALSTSNLQSFIR